MLTRKLSTRSFILSQIIILLVSLLFLGTLYYLLNFYNQVPNKTFFQAGPVTRPPVSLTLELTSPEDNLLTFEGKLLISGKTSPNLQVLITSETKDLIIQSKSDGRFSADFDLTEGVNNIAVASFDKTGDQKSIKRTVYYSKEKI